MARVALTTIALAACGRLGFDARIDIVADARADAAVANDASAGAPTLLAHTMVNVEASGLTTSPIDTTGASLIVLAECTWSTGTPTIPTDSEGNTWQALGSYGANGDPSNIRMFYAFAPMTNAAHTFHDVGNDFLSIGVLAFAGTGTTVTTPDDATGSTGATPLTFGPLQPGTAGELVATFACSGNSVATATSIDLGFTHIDMILNGNSGAPEDMASAYEVTASTTAIVPTWTFTGDAKVCVAGAVFR